MRPPEIGSVRPRAIGREERAFGGISARSVSLGAGGGVRGVLRWGYVWVPGLLSVYPFVLL